MNTNLHQNLTEHLYYRQHNHGDEEYDNVTDYEEIDDDNDNEKYQIVVLIF